jgi:hypothetical protein
MVDRASSGLASSSAVAEMERGLPARFSLRTPSLTTCRRATLCHPRLRSPSAHCAGGLLRYGTPLRGSACGGGRRGGEDSVRIGEPRIGDEEKNGNCRWGRGLVCEKRRLRRQVACWSLFCAHPPPAMTAIAVFLPRRDCDSPSRGVAPLNRNHPHIPSPKGVSYLSSTRATRRALGPRGERG